LRIRWARCREAPHYSYSTWLDDVGLKRAVLVYDRLLFVDPVDKVIPG
jgi:hypothetical protein